MIKLPLKNLLESADFCCWNQKCLPTVREHTLPRAWEENPMLSDGFLGEAKGTNRESRTCTSAPTRKLVLIVDDEEPLRVMLGLLLRKTGVRVLLAATGNDALRICARLRRPIDLLITDIQLPELSGFDLSALLAVERPAMPVLFISGALTEHDPELTTRICPGREFLAKPFTPKMLETKVESMLVSSQDARSGLGPANFRLSVLEAC
jgi:CheY-like chemotaxis protein